MKLRLPEILCERDFAVLVEGNAFFFQQDPLQVYKIRITATADFTFGIDDAVPRQSIIIQYTECITHLAGMSRDTGQFGNLAVGGYTATGDFLYSGVNLLVTGRHYQSIS